MEETNINRIEIWRRNKWLNKIKTKNEGRQEVTDLIQIALIQLIFYIKWFWIVMTSMYAQLRDEESASLVFRRKTNKFYSECRITNSE